MYTRTTSRSIHGRRIVSITAWKCLGITVIPNGHVRNQYRFPRHVKHITGLSNGCSSKLLNALTISNFVNIFFRCTVSSISCYFKNLVGYKSIYWLIVFWYQFRENFIHNLINLDINSVLTDPWSVSATHNVPGTNTIPPHEARNTLDSVSPPRRKSADREGGNFN